MRKDIQYYLDQQPDLKYFIRTHPDWYQRLSRYPAELITLKQGADDFFGKTFSKKVERMTEKVDLIAMLLQMAVMDEDAKEGESSEGN